MIVRNARETNEVRKKGIKEKVCSLKRGIDVETLGDVK